MTNSDFDMIDNIVKGISYPAYKQESNPDYWKNVPVRSGILKTFTDTEIVSNADDGDTEIVYFSSDDKKAGCAIFQCLTEKNPQDVLNLIDDDEKQMDFLGFTISIELEKNQNQAGASNLRCATIAFMMQDEDAITDILHEDIRFCLDELIEEAKSILHP